MGACTFYSVAQRSDFDAPTAFQELCNEDRYENGHSYSGGIGMKTSFLKIGTAQTLDEAYAMARDLIHNQDPRVDDKWGPAGMIEITGDDQAKFLFFGWASS